MYSNVREKEYDRRAGEAHLALPPPGGARSECAPIPPAPLPLYFCAPPALDSAGQGGKNLLLAEIEFEDVVESHGINIKEAVEWSDNDKQAAEERPETQYEDVVE